MDSVSPESKPRRSLPRTPPARRAPLVVRKRQQRAAARARIAAHTRQPLGAAQRAQDLLRDRGRSPGVRLGKAVAAIAGSLLVHAAVVVIGVLLGGAHKGTREIVDQQVKIEVRERPPEPPPEKPPEPPEPARVEQPVRPPPKVAKAPPPPEPKGPPPRVIGLSMEATSEGGGGPSFAVGNTRAGQTAAKAEAPAEVAPVAPPTAPIAATSNRAASRVPTAGVAYSMPKRKAARKPPYPETLKSQGIEADVTVMVSLDAAGKVTSAKVIKGAPYPAFNEAALKAAQDEDFEPATRDGTPIPYTLSFTYRFRLEDQ